MTPKYSYLLGKSSKIDKSDKYTNYENYIMYLAPHTISGINVCPHASPGCAAACLFTAGRGRFNNVQLARLNRTRHYISDRKGFLLRLEKEITSKKHKKLAIRCNGTSDINWISFIRRIHKKHPKIVFYDYTKNPSIAKRALEIPYYHVTFSRSETNEAISLELLKLGINVAVVFKELPKTWKGYKVIDGDKTDARFLDDVGVIVGLKAKGDARKPEAIKNGFVVNV